MSAHATHNTRLALHGGEPLIQPPVPTFSGGLGADAIDHEEIHAVTQTLLSKNLFRHNPESQTRAFEHEAANLIGVRHALAVNSGTSALICALHGLGIGPGDEVIVPAYTYIATPAAVAAVGAVPVIAEIDESLGLDPADLPNRITPRTRAIIPVHMQGIPARLHDILHIAQQHNIPVIEDCAQAIGARYHRQIVGTFGHAGIWSFNHFKILTAGEGGLLFTNHEHLFERACLASDPAMPLWMRDHEDKQQWSTPPFSLHCFRASEIASAILRVQLRKLHTLLTHTRTLKTTFLHELHLQPRPRGYRLQHVDDPEGDCGISAAILCHDPDTAQRYAEALRAEGLPCGTAYNPAGFPDRHIYRNWTSILQQNSPHPAGYPWKDPHYTRPLHNLPPGNITYHPEGCPRSLYILHRAIRFSFNLRMTQQHAQLMARAIAKVDAALA